jgi:hypothetical protein
MYPTAALTVVLLLAPVALAEETGGAVPIPVRGQIAIGKAMTPAQKVTALEEALNKETDLRVELGAKVESLTEENAKLASAHQALSHDKATVDGELARTRDALSRAQRDFESLRAGYAVIARTISLSLPFIVCLTLVVFILIGWLLLITRKLTARVHDVPTIAQILEFEGQIAHLHEQINADKNHIAALKERLANLGIVD